MSRKDGKELIGEQVVVPFDTVKQEARKIANTEGLGEEFVPDTMKEGERLRGVITGYDEKTRKYQVEIDKLNFPLYFFRNEIIFVNTEDLNLIEDYNARCETDSDEDEVQPLVTDTETKMKLKF